MRTKVAYVEKHQSGEKRGDRAGWQDALQAKFMRGAALHQQGKLADAEAVYRDVLRQQPNHFDALHLLGVLATNVRRPERAAELIRRAIGLNSRIAAAHHNLGNALLNLRRPEDAIASYQKAIALRPGYADAFNNRGTALQTLNRFAEALASYDRAIALKPNSAEAMNNRGNALQGLKRFDEALASYERAIALKADYPEAFNNCGTALRVLNRLYEAVVNYDKAIALKPDYADAFFNRGNALRELNRLDEALSSYDKAIALKPDEQVLSNRGDLLRYLNRLDDALASYDRAIELKPDTPESFAGRGDVLKGLNRPGEALASYNKAIALRPNYAEAFNSRGNALRDLHLLDQAVENFDRAIALKPDFAEAFTNRGVVLKDLNRRGEALASYDQALALKPNSTQIQFARCMVELPVLYEVDSEIIEQRLAYERRLRALCGGANGGAKLGDFARGVGFAQPFFLAYQGCNDRDLQALYGSFVCRVMAERYPPAVVARPPAADEPVRVGIVSAFFREHSNWKLPIKGWLSQLDRQRFKIFGYHTGTAQDADTKAAAALCDRFVQGPLTTDRWRSEILSDAPHVLIYPEIGMDPVGAKLAAQRLAPVQCNSWGHPDTSGFSTLDYYLSSELMEPPDGQDHYTERLVRLPNLSVYCEPTDPPSVSVTRQELGLRPTATVYWSGQSLFKYLPQFDDVYPRIARDVGDCQFVFIEYQRGPQVTELFRRRLDRAFAAFGLKADDHCVFLPRLDKNRFVAAIGQCDVILDSISWSGCNSILESLPNDLPIVTLPGPLMRGRHALAILKMMDVTETIARSTEEYVSIAAGLARDVEWRMAVKAKIAANKHRLYYDDAAITGLEQFLDHVARRGPEAIPAAGSSSPLPLQSAA